MVPSSWQWRAHIPSPDVELEATSGNPEDYDDRNGYLPDFLGDSSDFLVPLPLLKDQSDLVQVERAPKERPFELRYQNFSVIMSRSRRFCCLTGVNIDGSAPFFRFKRPGWKTDPRIPKAAQIDGAEFYVPTVFDRGHMVRRLDPVWGTEGAGRLANADTHHYTNSCPQVHSFNDATWGDLEDWILSQERSRDSKGSVFTGPIFQESDPVYEGVKVPVAFYKVVAVVDDAKGQLGVTAFEMDQSDVMPPQPGALMPEAPFDPGRFSVDQITLSELEERSGLDFDTTDFAAALEAPDSHRRFHVVEDAKELAEILNAPLDQWRVFLHPSQKKIVEWNANGPVRVLGGAGTGKTVAAMHRARWLSQNFAVGEHDRILFTTFTKNLAEDILQNLRKICSVELLRKIEVINLDGWVANFLRKSGYDYKLLFNGAGSEQWKSALNQAPESLNDAAFLRDEWEQVIQANGVRSFEDYLRASRIGRGRRLTRLEKKSIWPIFEEYRAQLNARGLKELIDATRDARSLLERQGDVLPYKAVLVDEAQDMGTEAFKLIRQLIPPSRVDQQNGLFITGDAHQRIYGQRVVLSHCGIDVRGRSRKLRVNYRTTEETRKWAVRLLEGRSFDDLDGNLDSQKGYCSLLRGEPPGIVEAATFADETKKILDHLKTLQKSGVDLDNVCLVARTNELIDQYEGAIKAAGIPVYRIRRSIAEDRRSLGLRLATMHRVKGLEFDYVIVAGVDEGVVPLVVSHSFEAESFETAESETRERALLYVAVTRAKRCALITCHAKKSPFLVES